MVTTAMMVMMAMTMMIEMAALCKALDTLQVFSSLLSDPPHSPTKGKAVIVCYPHL
jgi:hypothetical protein